MKRAVTDRSDSLLAEEPRPRQYKVGFLYNHEAPHQVAHSAPIAGRMATMPDFAVEVLAVSKPLLDEARTCMDPQSASRIVFTLLPRTLKRVTDALDKVIPAGRIVSLMKWRDQLAQFDALVVPERTSLFLKRLLGAGCPALIFTGHDSGDRAHGFMPALDRFDFLLLSGKKQLRRMQEEGRCTDPARHALIGYPKFEVTGFMPQRSPPFANGKPTVLYNPHFAPHLSSWFDMGRDVLAFFHGHGGYNLIFAPHVMLFRRAFHISLEDARMRLRGTIPQRYFTSPHIHIDLDGPALFDMSYTRAADIYMGDVSSQVYEFLAQPRPCIFLDPRRRDWQTDPHFRSWTYGPVVTEIAQLEYALKDCVAHPERYRAAQQRGMRETFDSDGRSSSLKAAESVRRFLIRRETSPT